MADIFISYSSDDKSVVQKIAALLEKRGWSVWWDRQIPIGQKYDTVIEQELQVAVCVLVVWTQRSITSEWVKNEALDAAQKGILVPVILEPVILPLAFRRIESAMLIGWQGNEAEAELEMLFNAIGNIIDKKKDIAGNTSDQDGANKEAKLIGHANDAKNKMPPAVNFSAGTTGYKIIAAVGLILSVLLYCFYQFFLKAKLIEGANQALFYLLLIIFAISLSSLVFGTLNFIAAAKGKQFGGLKATFAIVGILMFFIGGFYQPTGNSETNVTVRIFDWRKNPIKQGNVKIYLKEYIRTQSIDDMGQALFTGIPATTERKGMKIEVSSPGYATKVFDTALNGTGLLELTLPLTTVVFISGKVKTAAEIPIKGVEIDVEGTRYYAISLTDGSYNLRLEEYTLGDEITITTSQKNYEDKTFSLKITSPEIKNQDIFLNPITQ
ncbi:MAG: toll/interleukin-1 receptor domain-containing protein [Ferruginibacter sp.]